ncbi:MAG: elongation factor P [Vampirovibrionales bacterium]
MMAVISTNDFKTGITLEIDSQLLQVVEFLHVKPGKGSAFVRSKLKNVLTGQVLEKTFRAGEKLDLAHLEKNDMSFLYSDGADLTFMDTVSFEQISIPADMLGDKIKYLKENMNCFVMRHNDKVVMVEVPSHVELRVVETPPNEKGNTAQGGSKPATLESGAVVQVPFFINNDDVIRVDTRDNKYLDRVTN